MLQDQRFAELYGRLAIRQAAQPRFKLTYLGRLLSADHSPETVGMRPDAQYVLTIVSANADVPEFTRTSTAAPAPAASESTDTINALGAGVTDSPTLGPIVLLAFRTDSNTTICRVKTRANVPMSVVLQAVTAKCSAESRFLFNGMRLAEAHTVSDMDFEEAEEDEDLASEDVPWNIVDVRT